jgi:hypothetical protein
MRGKRSCREAGAGMSSARGCDVFVVVEEGDGAWRRAIERRDVNDAAAEQLRRGRRSSSQCGDLSQREAVRVSLE